MNIKQIAKMISEDIDAKPTLLEQQSNDQLEGIKSEIKTVVQKLLGIFDRSKLPRQQAMQLLTQLIQEVAAAGNLNKSAVQQVYQNTQKRTNQAGPAFNQKTTQTKQKPNMTAASPMLQKPASQPAAAPQAAGPQAAGQTGVQGRPN